MASRRRTRARCYAVPLELLPHTLAAVTLHGHRARCGRAGRAQALDDVIVHAAVRSRNSADDVSASASAAVTFTPLVPARRGEPPPLPDIRRQATHMTGSYPFSKKER